MFRELHLHCTIKLVAGYNSYQTRSENFCSVSSKNHKVEISIDLKKIPFLAQTYYIRFVLENVMHEVRHLDEFSKFSSPWNVLYYLSATLIDKIKRSLSHL